MKRRGDDWDEAFDLLTSLAELSALADRVEDGRLKETLARHAGEAHRLEKIARRLVAQHDQCPRTLVVKDAQIATLRLELERAHRSLADAKGRAATMRGGAPAA